MKTVLITAGGTSEHLDRVRKVTNSSTGKLGSLICAELLAQKGDEIGRIYYVCAPNALQPETSPKVTIVPVVTVADLEHAVREIMGCEPVDYVVHAMAVSDYTPAYATSSTQLAHELAEFVTRYPHNTFTLAQWNDMFAQIIQRPEKPFEREGKISSSEADLVFRMVQTPKIISLFKELQPHTFLVGFKLLDSVEAEVLFDTAFRLLRKNRCNLVLANDLAQIKQGQHDGMLVYPEKKYDLLHGKAEIASHLVETMWKRSDSRHPKSIQVSTSTAVPAPVLQELQETGAALFANGLLPTVEGGTYGNLSIRNGDRFWITGRNVHKGKLTERLLTSVERVAFIDDPAVYSHVYYHGAVKPSIDSSIHAAIYAQTGHQAILHVHTDHVYAGVPLNTYNFPCGTEKEMQSILDVICAHPKSNVVQLYKHGLVVLGQTLTECVESLRRLMNETVAIVPLDPEEHQEAFAEWQAHYHEVAGGSTLDVTDTERYHVIFRGTEGPAGVVYSKRDGEHLTFAIYTLAAYQRRGMGLGSGVLAVLMQLGRNQGCTHLRLVTKDACGVEDYYVKKQGFALASRDAEVIRLVKPILA